jgi:hypothetical protein
MTKLRLFSLCLAIVPVTNAMATDYAWNIAGDGLWTLNNNWSPVGQPNAAADNVFIGAPGASLTPVTVTLSASTTRAVGTFALASSTGNANTLSLLNGATLDLFAGGVNSNGVIRFDNTSSAGTTIRVNNNLTFNGIGRISMSGAGSGSQIIASAAGLNSGLVNSATHTIEGAGALGGNTLVVYNEGLINANLAGRTLAVDALAGGTNRSTMSATNGGMLAVLDGSWDNASNGIISADGAGSVAEFREGALIIGGIVRGTNGGVARVQGSTNAFFNGVRFEGAISALTNCDFGVANDIVNTGTITVEPTNSAATDIEVQAGGVSFSGGGKIVLGGTAAGTAPGINGDGLSTLNNAADHTIEGKGRLGQNSIGITNAGLIRANNTTQSLVIDPIGDSGAFGATAINTGTFRAVAGSTLQFQDGYYSNAGAVIEADGAGAVVDMTNLVRIQGGTVRGINGGVVQVAGSSNVFFENLTFTGSIKGLTNCDFGIGGTITNNGTISIEPVNTAATDVEVQIDGAMLAGTGTLTLGGPSTNPGINGVVGDPTLTNGATHTINGKGRFGQNSIGIINNGVIAANDITQALVIDPANAANVDGTGANLDNIGTMRADTGATLSLNSGTYRNRNLIVADGVGAIVIHQSGAVIRDGTLGSINGGTHQIDSSATVTWQGVMLEGAATVLTAADLVLTNTFTNNGTLTVSPVNSAATDIALGSNLTFAGTGEVVLAGTATGVSPGINSNLAGFTLTNGLTHTISGRGRLGQNDIGIINNGVIVATDATLALQIDPDATGFTNNSILRGQGAAGLLFVSGSHRLATGSSLIVNAGSKAVVDGGATLNFEPGASINQLGAITINSGGVFSNQSTFSPGNVGTTGLITMTGTFTTMAAATLVVDLGGTTAGTQYDQIAGTGAANLAGVLDLRLINGFDPALYSPALTIIDDTSGSGISGRFATVLNVGSGQKRLAVVYLPLAGATASEVNVVAAVAGDADVNGMVNFQDLVVLAQNYNLSTGRAWQTADFNGDGATNFADLVPLAQNYNYGTVVEGDTSSFDSDWALAQSLVPEPVSALGLMSAAALVTRRRR